MMNKFKKVQNIAWTILTLAFITCLVMAIGTPLSVRWLLLNTTRPLVVVLQPRSGTISQQESRMNTSFLIESNTEISPKTTFQLSDDAAALLLFYHPESYNVDELVAPVATVQLYGETEMTIEVAQTPRFSLSELPHRIVLNIHHGANTHISVEDNDRLTALSIRTPHGSVDMEQGTYTVGVEDDQTEFSVRAGLAHVLDTATGDKPVLTDLQRAELTVEGLEEIYIGERDILRNRNGDFELPLEGTWEIYTDTARQGEDGGIVRQTTLRDEQQIVLLTRFGEEHAKTGIRQEINQDIRGATSLRVRARVRVDVQTLSVCGSLGTECPVMVRIEFTDQESGSVREWLQGFYAREGEVDSFCQSCEWKAQHIQVAQPGVWYDYESPDLLPLLQARGIQPAAIHLVQIYASGHTYGAAIDEIAILIGE